MSNNYLLNKIKGFYLRETFLKAGIFLITLIAFHGNSAAQTAISGYSVFFAMAKQDGADIIITRKFLKENQPFYLAVQAETLETRIVAETRATGVKACSLGAIMEHYANAPYITALNRVRQQSFALQDAGIIHGYPAEKGVTLTVDLCPSHKPLDRVIFTSLINEFKKIEVPVPIALSISGRFMLTHTDDINWIKGLEKQGEISVTWINHTYNHHYDPTAPLEENFLLKPGTDLDFEILGTEIAMLREGLLPSVFFRFPGLVSDNAIVDKVTAYGLIPVGSDAWLAKGQGAVPGSIVLIHGNGNEPLGVKDFISLLRNNAGVVSKHEWLLYDLRETVKDEFADK